MRDNFESFDAAADQWPLEASVPRRAQYRLKTPGFGSLSEKLKVPAFTGHISRPRVDNLLKKALDQTGAVLVAGRAETGKTSLAAGFAKHYDRTAWYRIEAADSDWKVFSKYFFRHNEQNAVPEYDITRSIEKMLDDDDRISIEKRLIVLDDIHNVFDTPWFGEFFLALVNSISPNTHLICLSRSLPDLPLWRLRSKQRLSVIEEKIIAFDREEIAGFCALNGADGRHVENMCEQSFGRIGKLKAIVKKGPPGR